MNVDARRLRDIAAALLLPPPEDIAAMDAQLKQVEDAITAAQSLDDLGDVLNARAAEDHKRLLEKRAQLRKMLTNDPDLEWHKDKSAAWHFRSKSRAGALSSNIQDCVVRALASEYPGRGESRWFWFNDTCAPIFYDDTAMALLDRWHTWRESYQRDAKQLLKLMRDVAFETAPLC